MGGNALKHTPTRRYDKDEYRELTEKVIGDLSYSFPLDTFKDIPAYSSKDSFGDLDVLHTCQNITEEFIRDKFKPNEIVSNGEVVSFDVEQFQVDLIQTTRHRFDYAYHYFSFNDMGNLVGRIFKKFGLKHGHKGLLYVFRDGDHTVDEFDVTLNYKRAIEFVGLPYRNEFETLEDIFSYVASSPYFNPDIYLFENMNYRSRVRDAKRKTYSEFLVWCAENQEGMTHYQFNPDKSVYLPSIRNCFESFGPMYDLIEQKNRSIKELKLKFNGTIVRNMTGLEGAELGLFIHDFRNHYGNDFLLITPPDTILSLIASFYKTHYLPS